MGVWKGDDVFFFHVVPSISEVGRGWLELGLLKKA